MSTIEEIIAQNKRRTWLLVLLFPLVFAALGYACLFGVIYSTAEPATFLESEAIYYESLDTIPDDTQLAFDRTNVIALHCLPFFWLLATIWVVLSWLVGDHILLKGSGAMEIYREDQPEIFALVENLCAVSGLPVPRVFIINDDSLNAFATGRDPEHASIALTKGIVLKLDRHELAGVIAHELSHVLNRDTRLMLITIAGISFFTMLSEICLRSAGFSSGNKEKGKSNANALLLGLGLFFAVYGYILAPLIRLAISRTREYYADATAAYMTRNPRALAEALYKISQDSRVEELEKRASMSAMCIANPLKKNNFFAYLSGVFATHPPIEKRINALLDMDKQMLA